MPCRVDGRVRLVVVAPAPGDPPHWAVVGQQLGMGSPALILDMIRDNGLAIITIGVLIAQTIGLDRDAIVLPT